MSPIPLLNHWNASCREGGVEEVNGGRGREEEEEGRKREKEGERGRGGKGREREEKRERREKEKEGQRAGGRWDGEKREVTLISWSFHKMVTILPIQVF